MVNPHDPYAQDADGPDLLDLIDDYYNKNQEVST